MIVLPETCSTCGHVGTDDGYCQACGAEQPKTPGPPCAWCGKESCGAAGAKPFCQDHRAEGMRLFAQIVVNQDRFGREML